MILKSMNICTCDLKWYKYILHPNFWWKPQGEQKSKDYANMFLSLYLKIICMGIYFRPFFWHNTKLHFDDTILVEEHRPLCPYLPFFLSYAPFETLLVSSLNNKIYKGVSIQGILWELNLINSRTWIAQASSILPDSGSAHSLSPSAATLGHSLASTATPSTCSLHIAASPPRIFCSYISSEPSKLLYTFRGLLS